MQRTQVYLTLEERKGLNLIARQTGKTQSQLVREAVDHFLGQFQHFDRKTILQHAKGLWANRQDLPDFAKLRREFDRS